MNCISSGKPAGSRCSLWQAEQQCLMAGSSYPGDKTRLVHQPLNPHHSSYGQRLRGRKNPGHVSKGCSFDPVLRTQLTGCTVREAAQGSFLATPFWSQWGSIWYTPHLIPKSIRDCVSTMNNAYSHLKCLPNVSQKVTYCVSRTCTFFDELTLYG